MALTPTPTRMTAAPSAGKAKRRSMGMGSVRPQMQGPISGGAGGGMAPPSRGSMPLPPSAAPRPIMPGQGRPSFGGGGFAPPMMPGGGNFTRPQPPAGGPMMPPPMMGGGIEAPQPIVDRGFPQRGQMPGMPPMMGSIAQPAPQGMPPQGLPPGRQAPDMQARLQQLMAARGGGPVY